MSGGTKAFSYIETTGNSHFFLAHRHGITTGTTGVTVQSTGGTETRPENGAVRFIVRT